MEKKRTLYRLRDYKTPMVFCSLLGIFGLTIFIATNMFPNMIHAVFVDRANSVLETVYYNNINQAMDVCSKSMQMLGLSAILASLFSIKGFVMIFLFIRMGNPSVKKFAAVNLFCLGGVLLVLFFLISAFAFPSSGSIQQTFNNMYLLRLTSVVLISVAYIIFVNVIIKRVLLESEE